ncbi:uncharacterized protein LOC105632829 isoform X2 [Jatropha curcas]|nr:uncharacterized protein LOC105632829 isoform X2 [Jatropha curcas]
MKDDPVLGEDSGDDSDDCELTELHCELGMLEGQLCGIPYELYDLPDLREILSLETWNSCLTEEERFYLSAYLPDMDQQTFCLTMKELFNGSDLYFGSPLDEFFKRLKGGFYPPKVTHLREGLQFIKRKKYYHALRSFHDRMTQMFVDMRRMWNQCELSSSVEERMSMWKIKRKQRVINLLDLNKFPKDDHLLSEEASLGIKGMKSAESETRDVLPSLSVNPMKVIAPNSRAKGVLKMKPSGNGLLPNHSLKVSGSDILEQCRTVPKGVLKIVPKIPSFRLEQPEVVPGAAQTTFLVRTQGLQDFKFSSLPEYMRFPDATALYESSFRRQKADGSRVHSTPSQSHCLSSQQESTIRTSHQSETFTRTTERQVIPSIEDKSILGKRKLFGNDVGRDCNEEYSARMNPMDARRYRFGSESMWPDLQKGNEDFSLRSLEPYPFGIYHGREQHMALVKDKHITVYPRIPEAVPRTSAIVNGSQQIFMALPSDSMRGEVDVSVKKSEKLLSETSFSERIKDEHVLPLTYKRRKALAKFNTFDTGKTIKTGADLSSSHHLGQGEKELKIKFTGWKDMPFNKES